MSQQEAQTPEPLLCDRPEEGQTAFVGRLQTVPVRITRRTAIALLDTGSTQTLVWPHLVEKRDFVLSAELRVLCANRDEHKYPVAEVYLEVRGQTYQMTVGVVEGLSHLLVIGQDILVLPELVQGSKPVCMMVTRSQSQAQGPGGSTGELGSEPGLYGDVLNFCKSCPECQLTSK